MVKLFHRQAQRHTLRFQLTNTCPPIRQDLPHQFLPPCNCQTAIRRFEHRIVDRWINPMSTCQINLVTWALVPDDPDQMAFDFVLLNASRLLLAPPINLNIRATWEFLLRICFQEPAPRKGVTHWSLTQCLRQDG